MSNAWSCQRDGVSRCLCWGYLNLASGLILNGGFGYGGSPSIAIYTSGNVGASTYYAFSDARIKNIIGQSDSATDLKTLLGIKVTEYSVLEVRDGAFRTHFKPKTENIFVYGREVKDFRTVDYDAIAMLNVSATQELARKVDALQTQLDQTVAEKAALQKKLAALAARDQAREARLARLESCLEQISARGTYASLKH